MTPKIELKARMATLLAAILLLPVFLLLVLSVSNTWIYPDLLPDSLTLDRWIFLFNGQQSTLQSLFYSLGISISVSLASTILGFTTSKTIAHHSQKRQWMTFSYFPFILSPVIYAAVLYYFFLRSNLTGTLSGVMIGHLLITYPYSLILFSGFWNQRMKDTEHLVQTLGGQTWHLYKDVLIPMAHGFIAVSLFQTFLISWFEYGLTAILGVGKVQTLPLRVFQFIGEANYYDAALSSLILTLPPLVLLLLNRKQLFRSRWKHL